VSAHSQTQRDWLELPLFSCRDTELFGIYHYAILECRRNWWPLSAQIPPYLTTKPDGWKTDIGW
jgi:hypothetical protein